MTTYDDKLLAVRFAALAPEPLPEDWNDVLDRAGAFRPHRPRLAASLWRGGRRRVLVVALAAAVLVAAVGTAAYGTVRVLLLDKGFIGLPPVGATASAPESGELVVQWMGFTGSHAAGTHAIRRAWVYADGRFIWDRQEHDADPPGGIPEGANEFNSGYLEQRLAPEGVQLIRAAVAELLDRSRAVVEEIPAEKDPWWGDHPRLALFVPDDSPGGLVAVPDGDRLARLLVTGSHDSGYGTADPVFEGTLATPQQLSAIRRVYALLTDPASALPSRAWIVQKVRAYVPSHYAVCIDTSPPRPASELLSTLPERAADVLRGKSATFPPGGGPARSVDDCFKVETEEAREVAEALAGLAVDENGGGGTHGLRWHLDKTVDGHPAEWNEVSIEPYFPDGRIPFSAAFG